MEGGEHMVKYHSDGVVGTWPLCVTYPSFGLAQHECGWPKFLQQTFFAAEKVNFEVVEKFTFTAALIPLKKKET